MSRARKERVYCSLKDHDLMFSTCSERSFLKEGLLAKFSIFPANIQMAYYLVVTHLDMKNTSLHPRDISSNGTCLVPL